MAASEAWYREGLAFACERCGRCCQGPGGYVWLEEGEADMLASALGMAIEAFAARYLRHTPEGLALVDGPGGDCVLYDRATKGCRVYRNRPVQCSTWPWWPENLRARATWEREARRCPGMDRGAVWTRERIDAERARAAGRLKNE